MIYLTIIIPRWAELCTLSVLILISHLLFRCQLKKKKFGFVTGEERNAGNFPEVTKTCRTGNSRENFTKAVFQNSQTYHSHTNPITHNVETNKEFNWRQTIGPTYSSKTMSEYFPVFVLSNTRCCQEQLVSHSPRLWRIPVFFLWVITCLYLPAENIYITYVRQEGFFYALSEIIFHCIQQECFLSATIFPS